VWLRREFGKTDSNIPYAGENEFLSHALSSAVDFLLRLLVAFH
jgi:hypothetical protein